MSALVMSSISVVQYQSAPKLNVLQQSQNTNGREIIILRKPQQILPQTNEILLSNPARKKSTDSKMTNPAPVAVARRNARERNRVKQVNNGFATLRQHIPNSIAAAFESTSGRGGNKKLSKVETLRMAVEYIRSLEDILACDGSENTSISSSYNSSTNSSPAVTTIANNVSYSYPILSPSNDDDDLSTNPTPPPYQYNQNYQVISYNFYDDSENLEPLDDNILSDPSLIDADLELGNQDLSLLNTMHTTTGSLSPEIYSDSSLSPISLGRNDRKMYIPVFDSPTEDSKVRINPEILTQIKTEPQYMIEGDAGSPKDSKENMIQVMAWWEQQQSRS